MVIDILHPPTLYFTQVRTAIDRCIREVGIACVPVVEKLIEELQAAAVIHLDETPWYEKGKFCWLWVAITSTIAVYHIGSRRKEELLHLITEAFIGWLVTDGYGRLSSYKKRQHCKRTLDSQSDRNNPSC